MKSITSVILKNSLRKEKKETLGEKIQSLIAFIIVFGSLAAMMIIVSIPITERLVTINQDYTFIALLLFMDFIILFAKSVFESVNVLYFSRDLKTFLRMPIKEKAITRAKMLNMIIQEYQMEIIMLAIPIITYGIMMKMGILYFIYSILILLAIPIIPIAITSLITAVIMRFTNFLKNKTHVMYLSIIITAVILELVLSGFNQGDFITKEKALSAFEIQDGIETTISERFILIKPIMQSLKNSNNIEGFKNCALFIVTSLIVYLISENIISKIYLKGAIGTTINSGKRNEEYKITINDFKKQNKTISYMKKEYKIMSRSPIFFMQCILIPIMYPLAIFSVVALVIVGTRLLGLGQIIDDFVLKIMDTSKSQAIFIGVGQIFFMMNFGSIVGISKDSNGALLTKQIPLKKEKQFEYKTWIGKSLNILPGLLVVIIYYYLIKDILATIVLAAILYFLNTIGEKMKLLIDFQKPQVKWDSEYTMMKKNSNIMNVLFYTLSVLLLLFILSIIIPKPTIYLATILIISATAHYTLKGYISKNIDKIFKKVY